MFWKLAYKKEMWFRGVETTQLLPSLAACLPYWQLLCLDARLDEVAIFCSCVGGYCNQRSQDCTGTDADIRLMSQNKLVPLRKYWSCLMIRSRSEEYRA